MLNRAAKEEIINNLNHRFKATQSLFVVEYKGLNVKELEKLRVDLKNVNADFKIVKNSLLIKAAENTEIEQINDLFEGPTAIAICDKDSPAVAKVFVKSVEDAPLLKIKGALLEGKVVELPEIEIISKLPSREQLVAQFSGLLNTPMSKFIGTLTQMQNKLLYALSELTNKKEEIEKS